jgi:GT2 family glycosyltransferase
VRNQTRKPEEIIIIDNGSTDGTKEWLDRQGDLIVVHQDNVGGAGGFYTGFERAYQRGADWIWSMDDDGLPHLDVLANFEKTIQGVLAGCRVANSYVYHSELKTESDRSLERATELRKLGPTTNTGAAMFNGTFISRQGFEEIGNVNRDLFIWGDEVNYFMRCCRRYGFVPVILDCLHHHPFFGMTKQIPDWKMYYMVRNQIYNAMILSRFGWLGVMYVMYRHLTLIRTGYLRPRIFMIGAYAAFRRRLGRNHHEFGLHF